MDFVKDKGRGLSNSSHIVSGPGEGERDHPLVGTPGPTDVWSYLRGLGIQPPSGLAHILQRGVMLALLVCLGLRADLHAPPLRRAMVELPYLTSYILRSHQQMRGLYKVYGRVVPKKMSRSHARKLAQRLMELTLTLPRGDELLYDLILPQLRNGSGFINGTNDRDSKFWSHGIG